MQTSAPKSNLASFRIGEQKNQEDFSIKQDKRKFLKIFNLTLMLLDQGQQKIRTIH